jgi:hypothetical protein
MNKYIKNLRYILKHKWYVAVECWEKGLYWQAITHDMSKFRPSEFFAYADYFYGEFVKEEDVPRYLSMSYRGIKTEESVEEEFNLAWLKHIHRNPHHWQYYLLKEDSGPLIVMDMPYKKVMEMICDWKGAGRAIHGHDETGEWYKANKYKMVLSPRTRLWVESELSYEIDLENIYKE